MKVIAQKGEISLVEYDGGNYAVEFSNESLGQTFLMTKDIQLAFKYYLNQVEQMPTLRQKKSRLRTTANGSKENTNHVHYSTALMNGQRCEK